MRKALMIAGLSAAILIWGCAGPAPAAAQDNEPFVSALNKCHRSGTATTMSSLNACLAREDVHGNEMRYPDLGIRVEAMISALSDLETLGAISQADAISIYNRQFQLFANEAALRDRLVTRSRATPQATTPRRQPRPQPSRRAT